MNRNLISNKFSNDLSLIWVRGLIFLFLDILIHPFKNTTRKPYKWTPRKKIEEKKKMPSKVVDICLEWNSWYIDDHFLWASIRNQLWHHKFTVATSCGRQNQSQNQGIKNYSPNRSIPLIKGRKTNKFEDTNICLSHLSFLYADWVCVCASTQKKTHHRKSDHGDQWNTMWVYARDSQ